MPEIIPQVPRFIRQDKNGYALIKAMEAGLYHFKTDAENAWRMLYDPESMPEWRLDDMAWEWNMTWYDFSMPLEIKREMVRRAEMVSRGIGTPGLLKYMLEAVFETVRILEWPEYDGEPYHFMVEVGGNRAGEMEDWARRAVGIFKPLSRVFDGFIVQTTEADKIQLSSALEIAVRVNLEE